VHSSPVCTPASSAPTDLKHRLLLLLGDWLRLQAVILVLTEGVVVVLQLVGDSRITVTVMQKVLSVGITVFSQVQGETTM
jgi:hypothetical protein